MKKDYLSLLRMRLTIKAEESGLSQDDLKWFYLGGEDCLRHVLPWIIRFLESGIKDTSELEFISRLMDTIKNTWEQNPENDPIGYKPYIIGLDTQLHIVVDFYEEEVARIQERAGI